MNKVRINLVLSFMLIYIFTSCMFVNADNSDSYDLPTPAPTMSAGTSKTISPPTPNVDSGKIKYGTKITISSPTEGHIAYSINGSEYIYAYDSSIAISVMEDTELKLKAWIDYREEGVEYITPEKVYNYVISSQGDNPDVTPMPTASSEPTKEPEKEYEINNISILTPSGEVLSKPQINSSFIVETEINKRGTNDRKDYIFVAVYGESGLLSLDYVKANFPQNSECSFGFNIPAQVEPIKEVKAFVWESFTSMTPLAETKSLTF